VKKVPEVSLVEVSDARRLRTVRVKRGLGTQTRTARI
jgi:hypothetical protein